jgi:hypothetical protein
VFVVALMILGWWLVRYSSVSEWFRHVSHGNLCFMPHDTFKAHCKHILNFQTVNMHIFRLFMAIVDLTVAVQ